MADQEKRKKKKKKSSTASVAFTVVMIVPLAAVLAALMLQRGFFGNSQAQPESSAASSSAGEFQLHYVGDNKVEMPQLPSAEEEKAAQEEEQASKPVKQLSGEGVYSDNALMIRLSDDAVLFEKASTDRMYPASMTKIMTCILGLENVENLDEEVTIKQEYIDAHYWEQASRAGFEAGEKVTFRDVLYGVMLPSGAEACVAVCDKVAGSEDAFVEMMNEKAAEIGMENTHFTNAIGLHNEDHYSTCADFILLEKYALQNNMFKQIFTARSYTTSQTDVHPAGIPLANNSYMHIETTNLPNGASYMGGKTGYTDEALTTLASIARLGYDEYIMVTAHGGGAAHANIDDAITLYSRLGEDDEEEEQEQTSEEKKTSKKKKSSKKKKADDSGSEDAAA
ncbi:MAG: D-alanyl-D-alanine carboxypeptidase [Eubacterium sp.]|nr:D-alanyl-D-alanine carboxypeptidase [Eubacterium sp.]